MKLSKKQRNALREIDRLSAEAKRRRILAIVSILIMVVLIVAYNYLTFEAGIISTDNSILRAALYIVAMVIAGYSGIMLMKSSKAQRTIDGYRQSTGISKEALEAWKKGEIE